ncbi:MAG: lytic transglycosylase domain-containing protein [Alphaproteobacteria bacterium]|nr:lytic transglycosylase domain-containing protein [Alphaproteobacteria bacterium]
MGTKILAACIMMAAQAHDVPPALLAGIYRAEGGKSGQEVANTNGSYDLGPMQINTIWLPELARQWGISEEKAKQVVRDDTCANVDVAAWILRQHLNETHDLAKALEHYHSRTPEYGKKYKKRVINEMKRYGLLKTRR